MPGQQFSESIRIQQVALLVFDSAGAGSRKVRPSPVTRAP